MSPQRVRILYWTVYVAYSTVALLLPWHFLRGHRPSDIPLAFPYMGLAFSSAIAAIVCRAVGYSLARRTETQLGTGQESFAAQTVEVRSYSSRDVFKALVWSCMALQGAYVLLLFFAWVHVHFYGSYSYRYQLGHWYVVPLFALPLAGFFALMFHRARSGSFVAKADDQGVEFLKGGSTPIYIHWSEIGSATKIETFNIFGEMNNSIIYIKDAKGKVRATIGLYSTPPEQQQQFSGMISRHLASS